MSSLQLGFRGLRRVASVLLCSDYAIIGAMTVTTTTVPLSKIVAAQVLIMMLL